MDAQAQVHSNFQWLARSLSAWIQQGVARIIVSETQFVSSYHFCRTHHPPASIPFHLPLPPESPMPSESPLPPLHHIRTVVRFSGDTCVDTLPIGDAPLELCSQTSAT